MSEKELEAEKEKLKKEKEIYQNDFNFLDTIDEFLKENLYCDLQEQKNTTNTKYSCKIQ